MGGENEDQLGEESQTEMKSVHAFCFVKFFLQWVGRNEGIGTRVVKRC